MAILVATACAGGGSARRESPPARNAGKPLAAPWISICELVVGGTEVEAEATEGGVGLVFAAVPSRAKDVEVRVQALGSALMDGQDRELAPVTALVHPAADGAHLLLTARDATRAVDVKTTVEARVALLIDGGCPTTAAGKEPDLPASLRERSRPQPSHGGHSH